jgi:dTDP-4-dehydro-6-deoxy-alpha-D-glucopyranose 2,3-dehydratase
MSTLEQRRAILRSALTSENPLNTQAEVLDWLACRRAAINMDVQRIPLGQLRGWAFNADGNLVHTSGRFFSIGGLRVHTNWGAVREWDQPIIYQHEVGILGIICRNIGGTMYFLLQAKAEPGNIGCVQLSPTLQATRSNYTRVHAGRSPKYLEYFLDEAKHHVVVDQLQSEQGSRFLRKRNRNIVIEVKEEIPADPNFCWLTLAQVHSLMRRDNVINMDTRTVIACLDFAGVTGGVAADDTTDLLCALAGAPSFNAAYLASLFTTQGALHETDAIISWITEMKCRYELSAERIPLRDVRDWQHDGEAIVHRTGKFFSVIGVRASIAGREVESWDQPLVKAAQEGLICFLVKRIGGVYHFLVQAKLEAGNFDIVELAPTVQCINDDYRHSVDEQKAPFLDTVLGGGGKVLYDARQSEEGGRFFQEQNRNMIIEVGDDIDVQLPDRYIWMTLGQIREFIRFNNYFNVEARSVLAAVRFT